MKKPKEEETGKVKIKNTSLLSFGMPPCRRPESRLLPPCVVCSSCYRIAGAFTTFYLPGLHDLAAQLSSTEVGSVTNPAACDCLGEEMEEDEAVSAVVAGMH